MSSITQTICPLKQFENETGCILARGERNTQAILPWKGITREQIGILIDGFQKGEKQIQGAFHSWCIHKKSKKLYDVYSDPSTKLGAIVQEIMDINGCDKLIYVEYGKTPKYLERLLSTENEKFKNYPWFKDYKAAQDWSGEGYCFQRAHMKHKENKNWKIKFGMVFIENTKTGQRWNIEGNEGEEIDDGFILRHIDLVKNKVERGIMTKKRAKELIGFFMAHSRDIMFRMIDTWEGSKKIYKHKRDVSRKHHAPTFTKRSCGTKL